MKKILLYIISSLMIFSLSFFAPVQVSAANKSISVSSTLCRGSKGAQVKSLQKKLRSLGFYKGKVDGRYGAQTQKAVTAFQKKHGLKADGKAGPMTCSVMFGQKKTEKISVKFSDKGEYYNVKLDMHRQDTVRKYCKKYDVSFPLALAVMKVESGFNTKTEYKGNCGIMQINKCNSAFLKKSVGVTNLFDFEQNVKAGIYMLSRYTKKHSDIHRVLMCYNMGEGAAAKKWKKGVCTTSYSSKVVAEMGKMREQC